MLIIFKLRKSIIGFLFTLIIYLNSSAQDSSLNRSVQKMPSSLGLKYDLVTFGNGGNSPWSLLNLEYNAHIKKMPVIARLNYANRFSQSGLQFEADAYPLICKGVYAYVNVGYSKDSLLFPIYRSGLSLYVSLPSAFEAEGGIRLLVFNSPTYIYTASLGKYHKNYWFNVSTFLTPQNNSLLQSYFLKCRYYFNDKDYMMLTVGTGISPDNRNNNIQLNSNNNVGSKNTEISIRHSLNKKFVILANAGWMSVEYLQKKYSHQYNFGLGLQRDL